MLTLICLYLAINSSDTLASLLLVGYAGVAQFFPGVVLGLYWERVTGPGVFAGMVAGVAITAFLILSKHEPMEWMERGLHRALRQFSDHRAGEPVHREKNRAKIGAVGQHRNHDASR